jgi:hypothetical protein
MAPLADTADVESVLQSLADWPAGPLACRLPRHAGQREERYSHRLSGEVPAVAAAAEPPLEAARLIVMAENERIVLLEAKVAAMETELEHLRAQVADFMHQFQ